MEKSTIDGLSRWFRRMSCPAFSEKPCFCLDHDPPEKSHRYIEKWTCREYMIICLSPWVFHMFLICLPQGKSLFNPYLNPDINPHFNSYRNQIECGNPDKP